MAANNEHIIALLEKYTGGQASSGEVDELFTLLSNGQYDETFVSFIATRLETFQPGQAADIDFWKNRLQGGAQKITGTPAIENNNPVEDIPAPVYTVNRVHFMRRWGWAAASIILLLSIGAYFWTRSAKENTFTRPLANSSHIAPGKNGAVLTLDDGSKVVLDSLGNGIVADQAGTQVVLQDGKLAYKPLALAAEGRELTYNTMTTPKGRQFQLTLPDGTAVWLNAGSSIRYPTLFTGKERQVAITGEAYFEVAHHANRPFKVSVNGKAAVEVLGTHFNINAYDNEAAINTTLLEGSVKVSVADSGLLSTDFRLLKPGQQAQITNSKKTMSSKVPPTIKVIDHADIDKIMAWKNGLFNFEGASLAEVMRQVERWYDIEIAYEKNIPDITFEGKMTKDVPLKDLLVMLERSDIHFRIDNRKLIVLP
jgi:ferric-dicitrate binding protein FerR (iron transport regulator)